MVYSVYICAGKESPPSRTAAAGGMKEERMFKTIRLHHFARNECFSRTTAAADDDDDHLCALYWHTEKSFCVFVGKLLELLNSKFYCPVQ